MVDIVVPTHVGADDRYIALPASGAANGLSPVITDFTTTPFTMSWVQFASSTDLGNEITRAESAEVALTNTLTSLSATVQTNATTIPVNSHTGSYTLVLGDAGLEQEFTSGTAVNCTIPPFSSVAFVTRTVIPWRQFGAGAITFVAGAGVTLHSATGLTTSSQFGGGLLTCRNTNEWIIDGV